MKTKSTVNKQSSALARLLSQRRQDEIVLHTWQFELARRIAQVLDEENMTQTEFASRTGLTHAQVSALLHSNANPTLATLAKIAGYLDQQILTITNADESSGRVIRPANTSDSMLKTKKKKA